MEQCRHGFWRAKLYKAHPDMIRGDDYTRLRDRLEPILIFGIFGYPILVVLGLTSSIWPLLFFLAAYTSIHLSWPISWWLGEGRIAALPYAGVTFLRGFARTAGLCMGTFQFGLKKSG
jgi:hypothetical protein